MRTGGQGATKGKRVSFRLIMLGLIIESRSSGLRRATRRFSDGA